MLTVDLHSCDTSKTFALSIEHNFLLLLLASLKAYSEILSISETLYLIVLKASVLLLVKPLGSPKYKPLTSSLIITISKLEIYSLFIDEEFANSGKEIIGRIFMNKFNCFLNSKRPDSGFFSLGSTSYFLSPTAPNKIASDSLTLFFVSSGYGLSNLSTATPPNKASSISISNL